MKAEFERVIQNKDEIMKRKYQNDVDIDISNKQIEVRKKYEYKNVYRAGI